MVNVGKQTIHGSSGYNTLGPIDVMFSITCKLSEVMKYECESKDHVYTMQGCLNIYFNLFKTCNVSFQ